MANSPSSYSPDSYDRRPTEGTVMWWEPGSGSKNDEKLDTMQRAQALISEAAFIEQFQRAWHELNLWNATLYSNRELVGFNWGNVNNAGRELWPQNLHTENLIQEIGESMMSKASTSPLKPTPVPHGKSWRVERAVRLLDEFLMGVWRQTDSEDACVRAWLDGYISSIGCVRDVYDPEKNTLHCEPVFFDCVIVDNRECINRQEPRTHRIRQVLPRASIEAKWGVVLDDQQSYIDYRSIGDGYEVVVEAWRRPDHSGEGGYHMIACAGKILQQEKWDHDWVPLEYWHHRDRISGFFTQSGVESLVPYQVRQNELNDAISEAQDIACRPRMKIHANSQIDVSQWDNVAGRFVMWSGSEPEPMQWPTNLGELYQERDRNYAKAFSHAGQSEMFAHADLPQQVRLDSSAGVREFRNMEDARHLRMWTRFEAFRLRVAKMHLRVLGAHSGAEAFTAVYHPARAHAGAKRISYEAIKTLNDDDYSWTLEATPLTMMSPAARRETLRDYVSRGLYTDAQARRIYTNPNIEREESLELASYDDVYRHLDLIYEGKYEVPTEYTNLTYGIKQFIGSMHWLKTFDDVEQSMIDAHVEWIEAAIAIQQSAIQQQPNTPVAFSPTQGVAGTNANLAPHTLVQNAPQ